MPLWFLPLLPFLKGAGGWSAARFLNETLVKPSRARRRLAHVLAEEIAHNLQMLVGQDEYFKVAPNEIPSDFQLSDVVFKAVLSRLGELPDGLTGEVLLLYLRIDATNARTRDLSKTIEQIHTISQDPDRNGGSAALAAKNEYLRRGGKVYKDGFTVSIEHEDPVLRRLRVQETLFGRLGYRFRRKQLLNRADAKRAVADLAQHLQRDETDK